MVQRCCVPFCDTKVGDVDMNGTRVRFHRIPLPADYFKEWKWKITNGGQFNPEPELTKNSRVCSKHFRVEDYIRSEGDKRGTAGNHVLTQQATPSIFQWNDMSDHECHISRAVPYVRKRPRDEEPRKDQCIQCSIDIDCWKDEIFRKNCIIKQLLHRISTLERQEDEQNDMQVDQVELRETVNAKATKPVPEQVPVLEGAQGLPLMTLPESVPVPYPRLTLFSGPTGDAISEPATAQEPRLLVLPDNLETYAVLEPPIPGGSSESLRLVLVSESEPEPEPVTVTVSKAIPLEVTDPTLLKQLPQPLTKISKQLKTPKVSTPFKISRPSKGSKLEQIPVRIRVSSRRAIPFHSLQAPKLLFQGPNPTRVSERLKASTPAQVLKPLEVSKPVLGSNPVPGSPESLHAPKIPVMEKGHDNGQCRRNIICYAPAPQEQEGTTSHLSYKHKLQLAKRCRSDS